MRFRHQSLAPFLIFALAGLATAQERLADILADPATQLSRPADRARVVARLAASETTRRQNARARATLLGLPLRTESPAGRVQEIVDFDGGNPVYFTTDNVNAAISTGADLLRTSPYSLTGSGVTIGLWDGGAARASHQEFGGRVSVMDGAATIDHASHVGGTLIASGFDPRARGMAASATVNSYNWTSDVSEMTSRGATYAGEPGKIYLSNHSYGYVSGWNYVNGGSPYRKWEWWGLESTVSSTESDFGLYNSYARDSDSLAFGAPYYLIFRSAGNDNTDNPVNGDIVTFTPGSSTVVAYNTASHPGGDGTYRGGFETIGFDAVAKNVITVGSALDAVTAPTDGVRDPSQAVLNNFSACGPTDDGRIKPDVVANGDALYSSLGGSNTAYGTYSGTSMATPNATGSSALLIQQYAGFFPGQAMRASTLKGLLIHTADDRGNTGPDYKYGWGMVNVQAAADLIRDHSASPAKQRVTEDQLTTSTITRTLSFVSDGVSPISATLCWTDPAAGALATSDSRSARLVNNLNLKIIAPNGSEFLPFVMPFVGSWTQASMSLPATTGINNTDNVEQVRLAPPAAGTYQAVVSFSGTLVNNNQNYSLLISGSTADAPPPPPLALTSVSPTSSLSGSVTLDLTGTSLQADTAVKLTRPGQPDIIATSVQLIGEALRCKVDLTGAAAGAWDVVATNPDLQTATLPAAFTVIGAIWSENFDGTVTGWGSLANPISNSWSLVTTQSQSPNKSYFAPGPSVKSITILTSPSIAIPASATNLQLKFWQNRSLQSTRDGGKLEFSINTGAWFDVEAAGSGAAFASNGYNATIKTPGKTADQSDFNGQRAWSGNTTGFVQSIVNLTDTAKYAGKSLRLRWRLATDAATASAGWYIDSISLLGSGESTNQAPAITTEATSSSTETVTDPDSTVYQVVRTTSTNLSVAADDDGGEGSLTYTWAVTNGPHPVFFTTNASNAAKAATAEFEGSGDYQISVSARDAQGLTTSSELNVRVLQTASGVFVSPAAVTLSVGSSQAFSASLLDQFSVAMATQPSSFTWSKSGGGTISSTGVFTATAVGGPYLITAASGGFSNSASVSVTPAPASVVLSNLSQTYSGGTKAVTVTTSPLDLATAVTYNTSSAEPIDAGSYAVEANITNPNYQGSASATLVIHKATATVVLAGLTATYDGTQKAVSATATPAVSAIAVTYNGSPDAPSAVGTYAVVATVNDPNRQGGASGSLVISLGNNLASWRYLHFTQAQQSDGTADDDADPDSDSWLNLAEYALGSDPHLFTPPLASTRDGNGLSLVFTRPVGLPDVTYHAESSVDFGTWSPLDLNSQPNGEIETVLVRDPLDTGDPSRRFLRLRFERK